MKKYINGRSLFISVLLGIFLGIGFIFFFVPIRNASYPNFGYHPFTYCDPFIGGSK